MKKLFDELLRIKRFREEQAELGWAARAGTWRRPSGPGEAEEALEQYRGEARRREDGMYDDLCSRVVRVREIDDVLQQVAGLKEGERRRDAAREDALRKEVEAREALDGARLAHQHALRQCDKFVDLAGVYQAEAFKEQESRRTRKSRKRRRPHGGRANGTRKSRRRPMSTDRRIGLEIGLSQGGAEWDAPGRRRRAPPRRGRADSQAFARALKGADGESWTRRGCRRR